MLPCGLVGPRVQPGDLNVALDSIVHKFRSFNTDKIKGRRYNRLLCYLAAKFQTKIEKKKGICTIWSLTLNNEKAPQYILINIRMYVFGHIS